VGYDQSAAFAVGNFFSCKKRKCFVCGRSFHSCYEPVLANHRAVLATLTLKQRFAYPEKRTGLPQVAADTCMSAQQESGACVHDRVASGRIASHVRVRCVEHPSRRLPPGRPPAACRQSLLTRLLPRQHPHLRKTHLFFECVSLCLSRACPGKMIIFSLKWRKRDAFPAPPAPVSRTVPMPRFLQPRIFFMLSSNMTERSGTEPWCRSVSSNPKKRPVVSDLKCCPELVLVIMIGR
jgi:hypothetical protein